MLSHALRAEDSAAQTEGFVEEVARDFQEDRGMGGEVTHSGPLTSVADRAPGGSSVMKALRNELVLTADAQPLPGYRLLELLGKGGFGEVWKCEDPGGLVKAIKFVLSDRADLHDAGVQVEQEFRSLQPIKSIRHRFLLALERVEILDGNLLIVMELADRNLTDVLLECRQQGQAGIAREQLLTYLAEAAEALDLLNFQHDLQHLDVKPSNLFLIDNHVKVADFGLVASLEEPTDKPTTNLAGLTPTYTSPEVLRGVSSRTSDQYSLAIVYQELLTGRRPFQGNTFWRLAMAHTTGQPDLSPLPPEDRKVVARALSRNPGDRFASCAAFVRALAGQDNHFQTPGELIPPLN
jgi:serine/threonine protein kinase